MGCQPARCARGLAIPTTGSPCVTTLRLLQGQHRTGTNDDTVFGVKRVRLHQVEFHHQFLPVLELARTFFGSLLDGLDAARAPRLDRGGLPVGALNFVKVHDADDMLGLVLNFLVAMRYKTGDDHATAPQEVFNCIFLCHFFVWLNYAISCATAFAVGFTNDLSVALSILARRAGRAAAVTHTGSAAADVMWTAQPRSPEEEESSADTVFVWIEFAATRRH